MEERVETGEIHYVALGDRHSTTDEGTTGRVWYSGAPEPTDYREEDPGNVLVVDLEPGQIEVTPRSVGRWCFLQRHSHLTSDADIDSLEQWLDALENKQRAVVKLSLVGSLALGQKERLDRLLDHFADLLAALETWERRSDLVVVPDDAETSALGLSGFASDALGDLRELAQSPDPAEAVRAQNAMALLHRLVRSAS